MRKICTRMMCAFMASFFIIGAALPISALSSESIPYNTYEYNVVDSSVEAPAVYSVDSVVYVRDFASDTENMLISDMCVSSGGDIYLLDAGAGTGLYSGSGISLQEGYKLLHGKRRRGIFCCRRTGTDGARR